MRPLQPLSSLNHSILPQHLGGNLRCRVVPSAASRQALRYLQDTEIDLTYDADANSGYWQQRPVSVVSRAIHIAAVFGGWFVAGKLRIGSQPDAIMAADQKQAMKMRNILTALGPAFVKIGQAVSSRPDIVSPLYLAELEKLQDQIPPFPNEDAFALIQMETGKPPSALFAELTPETVAAASLGQVYKGRLRVGGQTVAVKVQRPGVREQISLDVHILRQALWLLRRLRKLNSDLPALLDEWACSLFRELDYRREAANGTRFKALYGRLDGVFVPDMYEELTTQRVLIMEWVEGRRLRSGTSVGGYGRAGDESDLGLVEVGVRCSLEQMLEEGYYHSDPHAGNLLRTVDGKLAYIDFGMMGEIEPSIRRGLIRATLHLVNREFGALADDFITLGLLPPGSDRATIVPALTSVFQGALAKGVSNISFGELSSSLGTTMYQYSFQIPSYYTLLVRSLSVLEGIALSSDPNYKVLGATYPWIARRLLTDTSEELKDTLTALLYKGGTFQFSRLESLLTQAALSPGRSTLAAAHGNSEPSASALEMLMSPNVAFVRSILLDEMAKGLDSAARLAADSAVVQIKTRLRGVLSVFMSTVRQRQTQPPAPKSTAAEPDLLLASLSDALSALPRLSDQQDEVQVEGISRLAELLQQVAMQRSGTKITEAQAGSMQRSAEFLRWLLAETAALSPDARTAAFWLPIELASKLSSRVSARLIRAAFASQPGPRSSTSAAPHAPAAAGPAADQKAASAFASSQAAPDMAAQQLALARQEQAAAAAANASTADSTRPRSRETPLSSRVSRPPVAMINLKEPSILSDQRRAATAGLSDSPTAQRPFRGGSTNRSADVREGSVTPPVAAVFERLSEANIATDLTTAPVDRQLPQVSSANTDSPFPTGTGSGPDVSLSADSWRRNDDIIREGRSSSSLKPKVLSAEAQQLRDETEETAAEAAAQR